MGTGFGNLVATLTLAACFILQSYAASHYQQQQQQQQQLPSAMVVGTVYCKTCFRQDFSELSHSIPGASVELKCYENGKNKLGFKKKVKTNLHGVFRFRLPLELSRSVKVIETCSVKLVRSRRSICSMASPDTSVGRRLPLKSRRHGVRVFSAGFIASKPLEQPEACNHESRPSVSAKYLLFSRKRVRPEFLFPPPIPFLPSPPNVGGVPLPPNPLQPPPSIVPSLQPPPSIVPPLPFQPSPPPFSVLPPLPFQPPPPPSSIFPPLPSIPPLPNIPPPLPSLVQPPPPPPPPPAFLFPPLPLPPFSPGNPPAASVQGTNK